MCGVIALVLLGLPIAEIYVIIKVGGALGALMTVGVLIGIGMIGAFLARRAGVATLRELAESAAAGRPMAPVMAEGALLALAGLLLIVPGFLSDLAALSLLLPAVRRRIARRLVQGSSAAARGTVIREVIIDTSAVERPDRPDLRADDADER